jgi:phosphoglycolate phosphatase
VSLGGALPDLVLIDLDGTLVDTIPDIAFSIDHMLAELGSPAAGQERVREWVGNGTDVLVQRALAAANDGEVPEADYDRALPIFTDFYARHVCDRSRVYDGVPAGLDYLHGCGARLACVTNKSEEFTSRLLAALALDRHFSLVLSGDSLARRKPDPMPLLHAAGHFGIAPADALFIGDSENDVKAARSAGFAIVCVTYGYNHGRDIRASGPDAVIDSLAELPTLFPPSLRANGAG